MACDTQMEAFVPQQWSFVLAARRKDARVAIETLAELCQPYRQPFYAYVRLRGHSPDEAQDLTREFFARLLQSKTTAYMKWDCAKMRSFLLTALNRFLTERRKSDTGAGAGGATPASAEEGGESIEKAFEHNWALAMLHVVYDRLKSEYERAGQGDVFAKLKFCLAGNTEALPYGELGGFLGVDEDGAKAMVEKLRRRFGAVLREEVAQVVATPADVEEELRCLFPGCVASS